ncbi:MAG: CBS domain-containing protein [archaeon]|nr:CBS domain-containing protein [archaeon]
MSLQLKDIQKIRKILGLTQSELAKLSGVSQSLIAKIEAGKIDPSFSKTMAIFETLQRLQLKNSKKVKNVMTKEVISADAESKVGEVVKLMYKHAISQMPVLSGDDVIGSLSEKILIKKLSSEESPRILFMRKVKEVMEPPFPTVNEDTPIDLLVPMLNFYPAILVMRGKSVTGIVTRADLLKPE